MTIDNKILTELFHQYAKDCRATWANGKSPHKNGRPHRGTKKHNYPWPPDELLIMIYALIDGLFTLPKYRNDPDLEDMRQHAIMFVITKAHAFKKAVNAHSYITAIVRSSVADYRQRRRRSWGYVDFVDPETI